MARPIKKRTVKSYNREIEQLTRLRTAIIVDRSLDVARAKTAIQQIDRLTASLLALSSDLSISAS